VAPVPRESREKEHAHFSSQSDTDRHGKARPCASPLFAAILSKYPRGIGARGYTKLRQISNYTSPYSIERHARREDSQQRWQRNKRHSIGRNSNLNFNSTKILLSYRVKLMLSRLRNSRKGRKRQERKYNVTRSPTI